MSAGAAIRKKNPRRRGKRGRRTGRIILVLLAASLLCAALFRVREGGFGTIPPAETPEWISEELLPVNPYSRPGTPLEEVNGLVIHYVGNPGTTAAQNHDYFAGLALTGETHASSHFLIGMQGEIIQNIPLDEIAYCSNERNDDTISIECCHPDAEGKFTPETYQSLLRLADWLKEHYRLDREDIIRHYDVTGKECPRWYVRHPEDWQMFLDDLDAMH